MTTTDRFGFVGGSVKLTRGSQTATLSSDYRCGNAFGKLSIPSHFNIQQYRWNLSIKRIRNPDTSCFQSENCKCIVGITSNRKLKENFYENKDDPNYAYYPMDCKKFSKSISNAYGRRSINWGESFTISIALNLKTKTINFFKNGKDQGIAYKNIATGKNIKYSLAVFFGDHVSATIIKDTQHEEKQNNVTTQSELQTLKNEIVTLKNNVKHLQAVNMEATKTISKLEFDKNKQQQEYMQQIEQLKSQNLKLLDEQKEMQLTINELEKENKMLKKKAIDVTNFEQWDSDDIINWIFSIENGLFEQNYGVVLRKEITNAELTGTDLIEMNTNDIKGFGINVFKHRKVLEKEIQKLVQAKDISNNIAVNEGSNAPTAYI
eukprot:281782_1